jgi:uncharacterized protein
MSTPALSMEHGAHAIRPPGLYVEHHERARADVPEWQSGVPVFVGFAAADAPIPDRLRQWGTAFDQWDPGALQQLVAPAAGSCLAASVHGFFANGGGRCVVLAVPKPTTAEGCRDALLHLLRREGPLDDRSDIDLVCVPDAAAASSAGGDGWHDVCAAALDHCEHMGDRFAILDAPREWAGGGEDALPSMLHAAGSLRSAFGALYFPWIAADPSRLERIQRIGIEQWRCASAGQPAAAGSEGFLPPCGHVAGLYARMDSAVGVQQAPANEAIEGAVDTSLRLTDREHAVLNEAGVNALRALRGRGVWVGGARTLSGHAGWTHVSTARVVLDFKRWLAHGLRDVVFEPQTPDLWEHIRIRLVSRCLAMQSKGALAGSTAAPGFFVKCDAETNPADERDLGHVVAHVGLAPQVPAEFILIRVVHDASGFTVSGLT